MKTKENNNIGPKLLFLLALFIGIYLYFKLKDIKIVLMAFIIPFVTVSLLVIFLKVHKRRKLINSGIYEIDKMSGTQFEKFLYYYFKKSGFQCSLTPSTGDYGADLIIMKEDTIIVVQAKRWKRAVGIEAVQQIIGSIKYYEADYGMVITNSFFTPNAIELAGTNDIELWDREALIKKIRNFKGKKAANAIFDEEDI